jgi:hypothetical protein
MAEITKAFQMTTAEVHSSTRSPCCKAITFHAEPIEGRLGIPVEAGATIQAAIKIPREIRLRNLRLNLEPEEKGMKRDANMKYSELRDDGCRPSVYCFISS